MNYTAQKGRRAYFLLLILVFLAFLALSGNGFFFRSGTAGGGILIIILLYFKQFKQRKDAWMIVLAFLFSIGGDWFLSNKHGSTEMFVAGIVLFLFAHVGYLSYALLNGRIKYLFTSFILIGYLLFFLLSLYPSMNSNVLIWATLIYLIVSCFSFGAAAGIKERGLKKWGYVFGIFLILFSDTIIAFKEFTAFQTLNFLILPTYYSAHISITGALISKRLEKKN